MVDFTSVNRKPAPLRNVAAFAEMLARVVDRPLDLPGLACFHGASGLGKTKSAIYGANLHRAAYVECGQYTTAKSLLTSILRELGVQTPRGTVTDLIDQAVMMMAGDHRRPLIVDEAHHVASRRFVDLLRELHDKSLAPIVLIGEETLPKQLETFERVHNRILTWVQALPCDGADFAALARTYCPDVTITADLAQSILKETRGNTRRIVVNLARVTEVASQTGSKTVDLAAFGGTGALVGLKAPAPRRAA